MLNINDFAHIGLCIVSAFLFALGTGLVGGIVTKFDDETFFVAAWLTAIVAYGITFSILYQMG